MPLVHHWYSANGQNQGSPFPHPRSAVRPLLDIGNQTGKRRVSTHWHLRRMEAPMPEAAALLEQAGKHRDAAHRARRLMRELWQDADRQILMLYADDFDEQASELERRQPAVPPQRRQVECRPLAAAGAAGGGASVRKPERGKPKRQRSAVKQPARRSSRQREHNHDELSLLPHRHQGPHCRFELFERSSDPEACLRAQAIVAAQKWTGYEPWQLSRKVICPNPN